MELWHDFALTLSPDDVLRGQGADPAAVRAKRPALFEAAESALRSASSMLRPVALVHEADVVEFRHEKVQLQDGHLSGPLAARRLAGARRVAAALCTIGAELEEQAASLTNPLLALALDGLGNAAVEETGRQVCARLGERARAVGLAASAPLCPGEEGWPLENGQAQVFALLDPPRAGVRLTSGGMMVPRKSMTFVLGLGEEMSPAEPCELCSLEQTCRYRHA